MLVEWDAAFSVGHRSIDDDHKHLITVLNQLAAAVEGLSRDGGGDAGAILKIAAEFFENFCSHSQREEAVMREFLYLNTDRHASHHEFLVGALRTLMVDDPSAEAIRINMPFILSAVVDHIERDDRDFGAHLRATGCYGTV